MTNTPPSSDAPTPGAPTPSAPTPSATAPNAPAPDATSPEERWRRIREQTPATRRAVYCNSGFSGPMSIPVADAIRARLQRELEHGPRSQIVRDDEDRLKRTLRTAAAQFFGADVGEIVLTPNTTEGINIASNGLPFEPGDAVVTTGAEHGGGMIPAYRLRDARGLELRIVSTPATDTHAAMLDRFRAAIDDRVRLVIISHITFRTGGLLPLPEIIELAHDRGAVVVVDGAQSAGQIPIDTAALHVDAYAVTAHKWLGGPAGAGLLYIRRDHISQWQPVKVGLTAAAAWDAEGAFTMAHDDPRKFEVSTASAALWAGALAALDQYQALGPADVWDRVRALCRLAEQRFESIPGCTIRSPRDEEGRTGLFLFTLGDLPPAGIAAYLEQHHQIVPRSVKGEAVRLCLHVFNTEDEIDRAAAAIRHLAQHGLPDGLTGTPTSQG